MPEYVLWNQYNGNISIQGKIIDKDNTDNTAFSYTIIGGYGGACPPGHTVYENVIFEYLNLEGKAYLYQNVRQFAIDGAGNKNNPQLQTNKLFYSAIKTCSSEVGGSSTLALALNPASKIDAKIKSMVLVDLTAIYGEGKEPTDPAIFEADFERWFGYPIGAEPYDEGSIREALNK